jgi:hypothetical protein
VVDLFALRWIQLRVRPVARGAILLRALGGVVVSILVLIAPTSTTFVSYSRALLAWLAWLALLLWTTHRFGENVRHQPFRFRPAVAIA